MNKKIAFDVEGPIINPGFDFAWLSFDILSPNIKEGFYEKTKRFDEADDGIWLAERNKEGWSTGTTPLISQCLAACDGKTDKNLLEFAQQKIMENKGISEIAKFLKENNINNYLVTSSYPAVSLLVGYKYDIPSSHIYCSGHQLSSSERRYFDSNRNLEEELRERSPVDILRKYPKELRDFLIKFIDNCCEIYKAYEENNEQQVKELKEKQLGILSGENHDQKLSHELLYLLRIQRGVMGGHKKKTVLELISLNKGIIYVGDGIVDADPLKYAKYGISVNCTNQYALEASHLNLATDDFSVFIPIFSGIINDNFDIEKMKKETKKYGGILFSNDEIQNNFNKVKETNKEYKTLLKNEYERM